MDKKTLLLLFIILFAFVIRLIPIFTFPQGALFEPDDYYYLSILSQSHGFSLPAVSIYDGYKPAEAYGLYLITIVPHLLSGINYFTLFQYLAPLFGALAVLLVYIFTKQVFGDRNTALLAALIAATLPALLTKTLATNFRGDSFINIFTLLMLILLVDSYKNKRVNFIVQPTLIISFLIAALSIFVWTGGIFVFLLFFLCVIGMFIIPPIYKIIERQSKIGLTYAIIGTWVCIALLLITGQLSQSHLLQTVSWISETQQYNPLAILVLYTPAIIFSPALALFFLLPAFVVLGGMLYLYWLRKDFTVLSIPLAIYLLAMLYINSIEIRFVSLAGIPISIFLAFVMTKKIKNITLLSCLIALIVMWGIVYALYWQPVDQINTNSIITMNWIKNNTASNATILTTWTDGSVVEGLANRFAYSDSVAAADKSNTTEWFLSTNTSLKQFTPKVDYILVRRIDLNETYGLCVEIQDTWNTSPFNCNDTLTSNGLNYSYIYSRNTNLDKLLNGTFPNVSLVFRNNDSRVYKVN